MSSRSKTRLGGGVERVSGRRDARHGDAVQTRLGGDRVLLAAAVERRLGDRDLEVLGDLEAIERFPRPRPDAVLPAQRALPAAPVALRAPSAADKAA